MKSYLIWSLMHWIPNPSSHMSPCLDTFALYFYPVPWMPFCPFALHFSWQLEHPFWWLKLLGLCLWHDKCLHQRDQELPEHSFHFRGFLWEQTWSLLIWRGWQCTELHQNHSWETPGHMWLEWFHCSIPFCWIWLLHVVPHWFPDNQLVYEFHYLWYTHLLYEMLPTTFLVGSSSVGSAFIHLLPDLP